MYIYEKLIFLKYFYEKWHSYGSKRILWLNNVLHYI